VPASRSSSFASGAVITLEGMTAATTFGGGGASVQALRDRAARAATMIFFGDDMESVWTFLGARPEDT
jgi:hypothetical protein